MDLLPAASLELIMSKKIRMKCEVFVFVGIQ